MIGTVREVSLREWTKWMGSVTSQSFHSAGGRQGRTVKYIIYQVVISALGKAKRGDGDDGGCE